MAAMCNLEMQLVHDAQVGKKCSESVWASTHNPTPGDTTTPLHSVELIKQGYSLKFNFQRFDSGQGSEYIVVVFTVDERVSLSRLLQWYYSAAPPITWEMG